MSALEIITAAACEPLDHGEALTAAEVLDALEIHAEEERYVSSSDALRLAFTCHALASQIATLRATSVTAVDVPPQSLRAAIAEPYVCADCDEQECVCWAYDETRVAPPDQSVHTRTEDAASVRRYATVVAKRHRRVIA